MTESKIIMKKDNERKFQDEQKAKLERFILAAEDLLHNPSFQNLLEVGDEMVQDLIQQLKNPTYPIEAIRYIQAQCSTLEELLNRWRYGATDPNKESSPVASN